MFSPLGPGRLLFLSVVLQKYKDVGVDEKTLAQMKEDGTLNWGVLPALRDGDLLVEQR